MKKHSNTDTYTLTMGIRVNDAKVLRRAAYQKAIMEGFSAREYALLRLKHFDPIACDLIMMLDNGSNISDGIEIINSGAERDWYEFG